MSRYLDTSTKTQMADIMVQYGRPQSFLLNEICMVILWQDYYGLIRTGGVSKVVNMASG